ncbi:hypothetical protein K7X08_029886 [Anisodus acutangulus]|uniref:Uncharacterized protein n=1 Tax=Anisodus acutangulus TaxID=402998 RepID=A0A9Q1M175_9SOLA|nr:hypothetical protein K7X08_029886 [Anisodus acutangulus]
MPVMSSPHLMASSPLMESCPDLTNASISDLLSRDMPSSLQMNEMDDTLRFASNVGLEFSVLDYMSKRGFHQIHEAFPHEIHANRNPVAINSSNEAFLQAWWGKFYEAHTSRFPDFPVFAAESFDKVAQTLENVVANSGPANKTYASDHTGLNISNVMPVMSSPHLMASSPLMESGPDLTDASISDLLSRDMPSSLQMNEMDDILRFANNVG